MEVPVNKLPENVEIIIDKLKNYIGEPIYFFGSVNRIDYFPNGSDIDAAIFTNDVKSMTLKIQNFFDGKNIETKKTVLRMKKKIIEGTKIKYKKPEDKVKIELVIYDIKYKSILIDYYVNQSSNIPYLVCLVLLLLKYLKYYCFLPKLLYYKLKNFFFVDIVKMDNSIIAFD